MSLDFPSRETGSTDPRIKRTRIHVIDTARQMLAEHTEPLSFTSVADRAFVARQTLYKHWGTIDNLLAETIRVDPIGDEADYEGLDVAGRAAVYLRKLVAQFDFGTASAFAAMLASSAYEPATHANLIRLDKHLYKMFIDRVGMATHDQFFEIVAPVMFMNLIGAPPGDALIDSCAERASQLIH